MTYFHQIIQDQKDQVNQPSQEMARRQIFGLRGQGLQDYDDIQNQAWDEILSPVQRKTLVLVSNKVQHKIRFKV